MPNEDQPDPGRTLSPAADVDAADVETESQEDSTDSANRDSAAAPADGPQAAVAGRWSYKKTVALVGVVAGVAGAIFAGLSYFNDLSTTQEKPTTPPGPTSSVSVADPGYQMFDDFTSASIESGRWRTTGSGSIFSAAGGALTATFPAGGEQTLTARLPATIDGVRFSVRTTQSTGGSSGGVYVILIGRDGQQRRVVVGPDVRTEEPGFGIEACPTPSCDRSVDYAGDGSFKLGDRYRVSITASATATATSVEGYTETFSTAGLDGVREVRIYGQSSEPATFTVAIDDFEIHRAG